MRRRIEGRRRRVDKKDSQQPGEFQGKEETMKGKNQALTVLLLALIGLGIVIGSKPLAAMARTGEQVLLSLKMLDAGPSAQGAYTLQTGEESTLSAAVASATLTEVVAAPTAGSVYLRGIWIEKSVTATGSILVRYGTGTNCGTGTTTLISLTAAAGQTFPFGYIPIGAQIPSTKALCLVTEGANTSVRALTN
jgi:hypothetical protein